MWRVYVRGSYINEFSTLAAATLWIEDSLGRGIVGAKEQDSIRGYEILIRYEP